MESRTKLYGLALLLVFGLSGFSGTVFGQTWGEFFKQKKTQKRYLLQQIAALQFYIGQAKKGYELVGSGLNTIKDFSNGEFGLHRTFISSLKLVSPQISGHVKVADIIADQASILKSFNRINGHGLLTTEAKLYVLEVKAGVIEECLKDLEELALVVVSGKVEMTTDQRMMRLDKLSAAMRGKLEFSQDFCQEIYAFVQAKENEIISIQKLKYHYGIIE
ncbi:hypothetical protein QG516_03610 [Pedobacter gandavensis]|uniref:hypothetical protein n=1 Tax=Pedobacter gandavensis TaxID=2679963 RepID=UPI002478582E|nr:hypothetical protein [Pedobacter gandavensis]WGQ10741.1 hypothetical protein QG516_03610 [Pedobacter gandavensis]